MPFGGWASINNSNIHPSIKVTGSIFYIIPVKSLVWSIGCIMNSFCFQVDPQNGTVGFGSGLQGWAFTLKDFAKMYCKKFKIEESKMMKRLWGDNFYLEADKKWTTNQSVADDEARGFSKYVLTPIYHVSLNTVQILCIGTDRSQQTVQTKIRLLIKQCRPRSNAVCHSISIFWMH